MYLEKIGIPKKLVLLKCIMQAPYLVHTRHEDKNGSGERNVGLVLVADSLHEANNEVVGDISLVDEVHCADC